MSCDHAAMWVVADPGEGTAIAVRWSQPDAIAAAFEDAAKVMEDDPDRPVTWKIEVHGEHQADLYCRSKDSLVGEYRIMRLVGDPPTLTAPSRSDVPS